MVIHELTQKIKYAQVGIFVNDFELFKQKEGENIHDLVWRFNALINALKNVNKVYSTIEMNRKLLNSLSSAWKVKVIAIEEAENLTKTLVEEIIGSLITHELNGLKEMMGHQHQPLRTINLLPLKLRKHIQKNFMRFLCYLRG